MIRKLGRNHTQRQWEAKFFTCGCKCVYCSEPLTLARATKDHLIPEKRGGGNEISNIVPACWRCNRIKAHRTLQEFICDRPAFFTNVGLFTGITKPIHQAAALGNIASTVEKTEDKQPNHRVLSLSIRDEVPLKKLLAERENMVWWRSA